jgi:hypothetical protein
MFKTKALKFLNVICSRNMIFIFPAKLVIPPVPKGRIAWENCPNIGYTHWDLGWYFM